jgi:hypothetical protein
MAKIPDYRIEEEDVSRMFSLIDKQKKIAQLIAGHPVFCQAVLDCEYADLSNIS